MWLTEITIDGFETMGVRYKDPGGDESCYLEFKTNKTIRERLGELDWEIRRLVRSRLEPGCCDEVEELYKDEEKEKCPVCGAYDIHNENSTVWCGNCGCMFKDLKGD